MRAICVQLEISVSGLSISVQLTHYRQKIQLPLTTGIQSEVD